MVLTRLPATVLTVTTVLATASTMGPNYKRPIVQTPSAYRGATPAANGASGSLADLKWFEVFRDETLTGLVTAAQRNLFQGELDLARLRQQELAAMVQLYRALGGGWDHS